MFSKLTFSNLTSFNSVRFSYLNSKPTIVIINLLMLLNITTIKHEKKGEISHFFLKEHKQADQVQTDPSPCITTGPQSSSLPEARQSQCGQTSQGPSLPPLDVSRDDTEQDSEPELPGEVIEPLPTASSTRYAVPEGSNDISRSREEGPVQLCLKTFPRTQHGTRKRAFSSSWCKDNSWLEYSVSQDLTYCFACRHFFSAQCT